MNIMCMLFFIALASEEKLADSYSTGAMLVSSAGCPVFVGGLESGSPAQSAGLQLGDKVVAVNGTDVTDIRQAADLIRSDKPTPVVLTIMRRYTKIQVISEREKRSTITERTGKKIVRGGMIVPQDTTEAEVDRILALDFKRQTGRVFLPTHYPANPELFYPGFEMFLLRDPEEIMVAGIEDGPGSRAGVHYGDIVISVNGVPVARKTPVELETMFSSETPQTMRLKVNRLGTIRTFVFALAKAKDVARQNGLRLVGNHTVPIGVMDQDVHCFLH